MHLSEGKSSHALLIPAEDKKTLNIWSSGCMDNFLRYVLTTPYFENLFELQ